jgi:hypothetical protein
LSLEQALVPDGELYIESTANGIGNYFHELWTKAVNKENAYTPQFYSFLDTADMFQDDHKQAMETFKRMNNKPFTKAELTQEEKELMDSDKRFTLPIICWRRMKINNSSIDDFNQEFPLTPEVAFVNSGSSVFDAKKIHERLKHLPKPLPNNKLAKIPNKTGLNAYELPEKDKRYSLGVDASEGIGKDNSAISIIEVDSGIEVAHYSNNKIAPHNFAELVYQLGVFYNNALIVCEKASAGVVVLDHLKNKYHYTNIYKSKHFDERGKSKKRVGFVTSDKTRPILINAFRQAFAEGEILINSKIVLTEMLTFVADKNGKIQHASGAHDDNLFACMLALFGCTQPQYKTKLN